MKKACKISVLDEAFDYLYSSEGRKKSAFICPTDTYAIRLLDIAKKRGMGIIGFDNIPMIDELNLELDSVAYDARETAKIAVEYMIGADTEKKEARNCDRRIVEHRIMKRGSV